MKYEVYYKESKNQRTHFIRRSVKEAAEQLLGERGERSAIKEAGDRAEKLVAEGRRIQGRFWLEVHAFLLYEGEPIIEIAG
jgi:hypothetical protein